LGQSIEGPRKNVRRFSVADLERHRQRFYGAKNLALVFAGAVEPEACFRAAERAFAGLHSGRRHGPGRRPAPAQPGFVSRHTDSPQTRLRLSFRTNSDGSADHPALVLLRRVLDGGLSARLQVEMVEKRGIAYEVGADLVTYADTGTLDIEMAVAHRKIPFALETLGGILGSLQEDGVTPDELERVRSRIAIGLELGLDSVYDMVQWFGVDHLFGRAQGPEDRLQRLESVQPSDLRRVARKYLRPERLTLVAVGGAGRRELGAGRSAARKLRERLSGRPSST
ncbi:MAG: pitrilysin family protein, partial [Myxococcota bacterium]